MKAKCNVSLITCCQSHDSIMSLLEEHIFPVLLGVKRHQNSNKYTFYMLVD